MTKKFGFTLAETRQQKLRHAEFISASNPHTLVAKILKRVQDDMRCQKFSSLFPFSSFLKAAFTLAEVLITLGIIGVVAAMTIPTLMNQTGQAEFKTGFKKIISTLNQAVTMNVALDNSDFSTLIATPTTDTGSVYGMFNNRMNVIKTGTAGDLPGSASTGTNYTLFFNDGMVISFPQDSAQGTAAAPFKVLVDVNGPKKPNKLSTCGGTATAITEPATACTTGNIVVGDQFSVRMYNQTVVPNGPAARFVMYQ